VWVIVQHVVCLIQALYKCITVAGCFWLLHVLTLSVSCFGLHNLGCL
jgi:hypothetical protein